MSNVDVILTVFFITPFIFFGMYFAYKAITST